ncbi:MAG: ribosome biogenesis GTPase YlqF [Clostridia bacterium]|nr:ribosome biogenesis GTPase YlqF [Clostridia bacterium]
MNNKDNKSCASTSINWYPGHMAKTKRRIIEDLKLIDVIIEILDSRIPISSRNPDILDITKNKKRIILLNKSDLSNEKANKDWEIYLSKEAPTILTDSNSGKGIDKVTKTIDKLLEKEKQKQAERGRINKTTRVMILGIPNVGKSSLINRLSKKVSMQVGNRPGVTREEQWIRIGNNIELLDTPGVLWPKFESQKVALNLAFVGTIKDEIIEKVEVAYELIKILKKDYLQNILERYKISYEEIENVNKASNPEYEIMLLIGRKRGALVSGGNTDDEKIARIILDDFRNGKLGKITLERI